MKTEKVSLENKAIFKGKDLEFLNQVKGFLSNHGLESELKGGVRNSVLRGNPRNYQDIDLAVRTDGIKEYSPEWRGYVDAVRALNTMSEGKNAYLIQEDENTTNWIVENESEDFIKYVGLSVEYKFRIKNPLTKTSIDLTFGRANQEVYDKGGEVIPVKISHFGPPGPEKYMTRKRK